MILFSVSSHGGIDKTTGDLVVQFSDKQTSLEKLLKEKFETRKYFHTLSWNKKYFDFSKSFLKKEYFLTK